ncbi:FAD-dependent monooxygenase [Paenibacillus sp. GD4]|uniref:NAD(P)/FAD-dependent oxidoreductase n=1 Tax=Paenibacillus sp. GD4 TaxID=3068890 RepID=UPI0027964A67|nr:FAD-dependent oxidoreductase [Paenibacillus sp. GD4]MDQ1914610.1 FAD-dependent monooxygenase [Paenibacillus sp. GD4]
MNRPETEDWDVIVAGAGLAGTSLAYALAGRGWSVLLVDRHTFPRHKVCGEFLSPEAGRSLAALGLDSLVRSLRPALIDTVRITCDAGPTLEAPLPGQAWGLSRRTLDLVLLEASKQQGVTVWTGATVTAIHELLPGGYQVELRCAGEKRILKSRVVAGAWGRSSPSLSLSRDQKKSVPASSYIGLTTHLRSSSPKASEVELYFTEGGYLGISPIEGGNWNAAALVRAEAFRASGSTTQGMWDRMGAGNAELRTKLAPEAHIPGTAAAVAPVMPGRRICAWDKSPHVGDAAAVISPLSGDGMALALRSAELTAEYADRYLRGSLTLSGWRRQYEAQLRTEWTGPLRWSSLLQTALQSRSLAPLLLRLGSVTPWLTSMCIRRTRLIR